MWVLCSKLLCYYSVNQSNYNLGQPHDIQTASSIQNIYYQQPSKALELLNQLDESNEYNDTYTITDIKQNLLSDITRLENKIRRVSKLLSSKTKLKLRESNEKVELPTEIIVDEQYIPSPRNNLEGILPYFPSCKDVPPGTPPAEVYNYLKEHHDIDLFTDDLEPEISGGGNSVPCGCCDCNCGCESAPPEPPKSEPQPKKIMCQKDDGDLEEIGTILHMSETWVEESRV